MKQIYRVGVIGGGRQGTVHARAYVCNPRTEVVAVADSDEEVQRLFCDRFGTPGYTDYNEMLAHESIDIAAIVLPVRANPNAVVASAKSGVRAIFCEKPLAARLSDADKMVMACEQNGVSFAAGLVSRNQQHFEHARRLVTDGVIGEITHIDVFDTNGQGGCHGINLSRYFASNGDVDWVVGWASGDPYSDYEEAHEDGETGFGSLSGHIRFRSGLDCYLHAPVPWRGVEVVGTRGMLYNQNNSSSDLYLLRARSAEAPRGRDALQDASDCFPREPTLTTADGDYIRDEEGWRVSTPGMVQSVEALVDALDSNIPVRLTTGEDLRAALEICVALRESARRKQVRVELPLANRDQPLYPVKGRWHYKKEVYGEEWYREQMEMAHHKR